MNLKEVTFSISSVGDDIGKIFFWQNRIFRGIYPSASSSVKELLNAGLIAELTAKNIFPKTTITDFKLEGFDLIIEHELLAPVTYPYEWAFSMLKDAALCILEVNKTAKKYGYQTKDSHPFNIIFKTTQPMFIDLGSFIKINADQKHWVAYKEFLGWYYFILKFWSEGNFFLAKSILSNEHDIMPVASYYSARHPFFRWIGAKPTRLFFEAYGKFLNFDKTNTSKSKTLLFKAASVFYSLGGKRLEQTNYDLQIKRINKISGKNIQSYWGSYHTEFFDAAGKIISTPRFDRIIDLVKSHDIKTAYEVAANFGAFSMLLHERCNLERIICSDYDEQSSEKMYELIKSKKLSITPLKTNFLFPVTNSYFDNPENRFKSDLIIALAVTHHLILTQKIPIDYIFNTLKKYSNKYIITEFMPMGLWDGKTAIPYPAWYTTEWFRKNFLNHFEIIKEEQLEENRVLFFGKIR